MNYFKKAASTAALLCQVAVTLLRMVEPEDVVLAEDDSGTGFEDHRTLYFPAVDEAESAIL